MSTDFASVKTSPTLSRSWLTWEILCNVILAGYFLRFVYLNGCDLAEGFRLSSLLLLLKVSADTCFHLTRNPARHITASVYDWMIGVGGAFCNFFYRAVEGHDHWLGAGVQLTGMALQVYAMLSLNRSIGFVAANRGVKTGGMYRFVRHPLYFAYIVAFLGFVLNHPTAQNMCVYSIMVTCLFMRTIAEERLLRQSPEYAAYAQRVHWRLIPYVL